MVVGGGGGVGRGAMFGRSLTAWRRCVRERHEADRDAARQQLSCSLAHAMADGEVELGWALGVRVGPMDVSQASFHDRPEPMFDWVVVTNLRMLVVESTPSRPVAEVRWDLPRSDVRLMVRTSFLSRRVTLTLVCPATGLRVVRVPRPWTSEAVRIARLLASEDRDVQRNVIETTILRRSAPPPTISSTDRPRPTGIAEASGRQASTCTRRSPEYAPRGPLT